MTVIMSHANGKSNSCFALVNEVTCSETKRTMRLFDRGLDYSGHRFYIEVRNHKEKLLCTASCCTRKSANFAFNLRAAATSRNPANGFEAENQPTTDDDDIILAA